MRSPRILFVYQYLTLGGVEVVMRTRLTELARRGIEARMLFLSESGGGESIFANLGSQVALRTEAAEIEKYLGDFRPDWISTIDTPAIIPIARRIVPEARIAYEVHTPYPENYALVLDRELLGGVSGIIVPSQSQKNFIALRTASPLPIEVVPNSLPEQFVQTYDVNPPRSNVVVWVGRLDDLKNWRGFINLAALIRKRIEAEFWIVGGLHNREEANLFEAIKRAGLMSSFRWLPAVNYDDMPRLYSFVGRSGGCLVSTSWGESFGMAVLEAMASRCPVVAPDIVGLRDIVRHRETGWLYPPMDTHRACDFVVEALQDSAARQAIVKTAELQAKTFTASASVDKLLATFEKWSTDASLISHFSSPQHDRLLAQIRSKARLQTARITERGAQIEVLSQTLEQKEQAAQELIDKLAEKARVIESLTTQLFDKKEEALPCLVVRLPRDLEEARRAIHITSFWPASFFIAAADESELSDLKADPSFDRVALAGLHDVSLVSFLRIAAKEINEAAPASADIVVVDAARFDIRTALSIISTTRDENPGAGIVSAFDVSGGGDSQAGTVESDPRAAWIHRDVWEATVPLLSDAQTTSECGAAFARTAREQLKPVVLAPISPVSTPIGFGTETGSSLGELVLRQHKSVLKRVSESRGAVIFLPSMAWNSDFVQRPHHLARHFAKLGYITIFHTTFFQDDLIGFREIEPNLFLYHGPAEVLKTIPNPIVWTLTYNYGLSSGYSGSAQIVYDLIDEIELFPWDNAFLEENHSRALNEADIVCCVSRRLLDQVIERRPDAIYLPNAVEYERFADDSLAAPDDPDIAALRKEKKPIAGYYGVLADWFDYELLGSVAESRPDWNFLLIGPTYDNSLQERGARLLDHPNVHRIGARPYESLAGYLRLFDVAIIPFAINNITLSTSPLKLYEYFAAGKPVITTPMPECEVMADVKVIRTAEEFSQSLDLVKARGRKAKFRERVRGIARENSWVARAETVIDLLQQKTDMPEDHVARRSSARESQLESIDSKIIADGLMNQLTSQMAETQKVIKSRDEGISWLSTRVANIEKTAQERGRAIEWVSARVAENQTKAEAFEAHAIEVEELAEKLRGQLEESQSHIEIKNEAISWLQGELALSQREGERLAALNKSLTDRSIQWESSINTLSAELANNQERIISLLAELTGQRERVTELQASLDDKEKTVQLYADVMKKHEARLDERERKLEEMLSQRNEAIEWLRGEVEVREKKNQRLIGSNSFLKMQLAKNEAATREIEQHLAEKQLEIEKIRRSFGWRLLSRYGRIKYRYLLPIYRKLNLMPAEMNVSAGQRANAPMIPQATAEDISPEAAVFPEEDAAQTPPALIATTREPEETERFDFYEALTLLPRPPREQLAAILDKRPPAEALHRHDVICFSIIDWEFRYQRPQQMMSQFAAHGHRVFYISTSRFLPADANPRFLVKQIKENVYEVQLAVAHVPDVYGEVIEGDNKRILIESLDALRRAYKVNDAVAYTMISSWGAVVLETGRRWGWRTTYDCMDEWENFPGVKRDLLDMEQELVTKCDLLVVTAQRLWEKWEPFERPMVLARNGVDLEFYDRNYHPNDILSGIRHPVVGYFGAIADWFDIELVTYVARARPDYAFVLLGGVFNADVSELESLPNVRLLGQQPYETMPQYLYHFDVCMIPFKINPITEATDPVKLYEYLSAGKPVVSVALSEVEPYGEYIYLAGDRDSFLQQLDAAIAEDDREMNQRRRKFAEQHSWPQRYRTIEAGISRVTRRTSIVIVTYNNLALNKLCLESVIRNTEYPNYEIIVVDNNSADGTPAYLRYMAAQYPNISVILNETNNGFARANNQGITISNGDYIVLLNNDTIVPPGWLSRLLRHLEIDAVGMVGPVTNFVGNEAKLEVDYQTWAEMEDFTARYTWEHDGLSADIYMLAMFCVAFRRNTYDEIGPLDEKFGVGMFEDDDYAQRMKAKGYRVLCVADVFVHHFGQAAFKKLIENGSYDRLFEENRSYYETKWNVTWTPHKHAPLRFERLTQVPLDRQAAGNKTRT